MFRILILIAMFLFFRSVVPRKSRRSPTQISPYMNSLDGLMSARQISLALDEIEQFESLQPSHSLDSCPRAS